MIHAKLHGFVPSDVVGDEAPPMELGSGPTLDYGCAQQVALEDARQLQSNATSEADFFAEHGFVLLTAPTRVSDWDREIPSLYHLEVAALVRERLLPGRRVELLQGPRVTRRGPAIRHYSQGVHSDGPLSVEDYAHNVGVFGSPEAEARWRHAYARNEVAGFLSIDFWRTTNMRDPLRHMPLGLCDPSSVDRQDIARTVSHSVAPAGRASHHLALRYNPQQAWYYYPAITSSEVIAFKMCEFSKDDPEAQPRNVFHTAFTDPTTPPDAEQRSSCEHRVGVMILRD